MVVCCLAVVGFVLRVFGCLTVCLCLGTVLVMMVCLIVLVRFGGPYL